MGYCLHFGAFAVRFLKLQVIVFMMGLVWETNKSSGTDDVFLSRLGTFLESSLIIAKKLVHFSKQFVQFLFEVVAIMWNALPVDIRSVVSVGFKKNN